MIPASHALTNGRFHQSRQRRQNIDGGIDLVRSVEEGKSKGRVSIDPHSRWHVCLPVCYGAACPHRSVPL